MYSLLAAMELPPTAKLRVAGASERSLPPRTARAVDDVLSDALRQRPDLLAGVAKLRASDAEIAAARSALFPKASLSANDTGLQQYDAAIALQTASEAAFRSASDSYAHGVGSLTDATSAQTGLATARAAVAKAHTQSLINGAALAFATGELTSSADFAAATPR